MSDQKDTRTTQEVWAEVQKPQIIKTNVLGNLLEKIIDEILEKLKSENIDVKRTALFKLIHLHESNLFLRYAFKLIENEDLIFLYSFLQSTGKDKLLEYLEATHTTYEGSDSKKVVLNIIEFIDQETPDNELILYLTKILWIMKRSGELKYILYTNRKSTYKKIKDLLDNKPFLQSITLVCDKAQAVELLLSSMGENKSEP